MSGLQVGDIILLKPEVNDFFGQLVASETNSDYCHAVMVYSVESDEEGLRVIDLTYEGVHIRTITATAAQETNCNANVMRLTTNFDPLVLKATALGMLNTVGFDTSGLFILHELAKIHHHIPYAQVDAHFAEFVFSTATELVNLIGKLSLDDVTPALYEKKMHCIQFIYNIFYMSGADYQLGLDDGFFLSDFEIDPNLDMEETPSVDKVEYISKYLKHILSQEQNDFSSLMKKYKEKSPVRNEREFGDDLNYYVEEMESDTPIASSLVTAEDLINHARNLTHVGYYTITISNIVPQ